MTIEEQILQTVLALPPELRAEVRDFAEFLRMRREAFRQQPPLSDRHHDLDELFGVWSTDEYDQIQFLVKDQRKVDPELWS